MNIAVVLSGSSSSACRRNIKGHRKLWELRVQVAKSAYRVFYFAHTGRHFVMLHTFLKKTQKTPRQEIAIAERRMEKLLEREADR